MAKKGRKRKLDSEDIAMIDWEKEHIMSDELQNEMKTMWEIPQIYHFLQLTKDALNLGPLSMYEMERMLLMPRASKQLAHIMTCLLSSPMLKTKLRRIPPMPYEYWTNILMHKIKSWFKIYHNKHEDTVKVLETTGVEPAFWKIFPDVSLIEGKDFEELTFRQRIWLLKTVCDAMMHARKTVQEEMAKQLTDEPSETLLGTDRNGARYIYFPQIMENDVRVYRHCLDNKILSTVKPPKEKVDVKAEVKTDNKRATILKSSRSRRRKCRWRNGSLPPRIRKRIKRQDEISNCEFTAEDVTESLGSEDTNLSTVSICSNNNHSDLGSERSKRSRSSSKNSEESLISNQTKSSHAKSSGYDTNTSNDTKSNDEMSFRKEFQDFSKNTTTIIKAPMTKDTILEKHLMVTRPTQEDDCRSAETESTKKMECKTNNTWKIDKKLDVTSDECDLNHTSANVIDKCDPQTNIFKSLLPESNDTQSVNKIGDVADDVSLSCGLSITRPTITNDTESASKELPDTAILQTDDLSNSSKTDDEKLNDIRSIDGLTIDVTKDTPNITSSIGSMETVVSKGVGNTANEVNIDKILSVSKSDDQKLIETKLKDSKIDVVKTADSNGDTLVGTSASELSLIVETSDVIEGEKEEDDESDMRMNDSGQKIVDRNYGTRSVVKSKIANKSNDSIETRLNNRPRRNVRSTYKRSYSSEDNKSECNSDQEPTLSELRDRLLKENKGNSTTSSHDNIPVWEKYNLRKPKKIKKEETEENEVGNFYEMLGDLSVSSFELVADSIEALRELGLANVAKDINDVSERSNPRPQCEIRLIKKINVLIAELEDREASLMDATKKARAKLHKEWTNFKDGVVEDQDWSSEGSLGLGSNWWVIGSQGCHPLPPTGDATISPLSQLTLPPPGTYHQSQHPDDPKRERTDQDELQEDNAKQQHSQEADGDRGEMREETAGEKEEQHQLQENSGRNEEPGDESEEEANLSSRRVLRARGVSSYMEQVFTSDDDIEEDELEGWPDVETKYAPPCTSPNTPTANSASTSGQAETWQSEDSDQDWILPCARKRKNRRPVARKLKTLQQKLQHMNGEVADPNAAPLKDSLIEKTVEQSDNQINSNGINQKHNSSNLGNPKGNVEMVSNVQCSQVAVPSSPICKITSVHSEIDIKDEITLPATDPSQTLNNYNVNVQPAGYVVVKTEQGPMTNYYLMPQTTSVPSIVQQSTIMPNIVPQVQQGYYVQAGQNYIVQAPPQQTNFLTTQTIQQHPQPIIAAPQPRQQLLQHTITQNYMQMPGYVVHPPPPLQPAGPRGFIVNQGARPQFIPNPNIRLPNQLNMRNRPPLVGNGTPFPHGAVIRSSVPLRGSAGRNNRAKAKNLAPRPLAPQQAEPRLAQNNKRAPRVRKTGTNATSNTTSLIVLSDSDDEIEMIITENTKPAKAAPMANIPPQETVNTQTIQKPVVTSHVTVSPGNSILPPQIMQRMSQGGISITPVKNTQSPALQNPNTQLVVVVNETGSHYALSLPNGSKLILTPDQVAQIRASNNGKLML